MPRLAFATLALVLASSALAADTDQDRCRYSSLHKQSKDEAITACNRAITSKRFRAMDLAQLHLKRAELLAEKAEYRDMALYGRALVDLEQVIRIGRSLGISDLRLSSGYYERARIHIVR